MRKRDKQITLYHLIIKNIMTIVIIGIGSVIMIFSMISLYNLGRVEKEFEANAVQIVNMAFTSLSNALYDFDVRYYKGLERFIEALKTSENKEETIKNISKYAFFNSDTSIEKIDYNKLNSKIKEKLDKLENYKYYFELELTSEKLLKDIYLKIDNEYYLIRASYSVDKIKNTLDNFHALEEKYNFIDEIDICTHNFENLSSKENDLTDKDVEYLKKAFDTGKEIIIKKGNKLIFYYTWSYEDEKSTFKPIGIVLKLDVGMLRNALIYNITIFILALIIIMYLVAIKARKVSKQISRPFELMVDNMKKFRETKYLEFDRMFEKCEIKEINELMDEYQKMAEDIMSSFEEINAMNEELEHSYKEIEKVNNELEESYLNFSTQLSIIAEGYDENTGNHVNRVGELSAFIAEKMGLDHHTVYQMKYYAPLHDIGKLMIPKDILMKKGKLTNEEWKIMEKHTIYGGLLIGDAPMFKLAKNIALYHHEKYDGSGYPFGLEGDKIPIEAAIVSVVDVYDALRSERPYKPAFSHEKALKIILEGDNRTQPTHFHPEVLKIFKEYSEDLRKLWEEVDKQSSKLYELMKNIQEDDIK
ncbi:response regulator containing a CheY-like receiver domain and an HD-GYP domain [Marinitoga piezophila KA3]|uniref:Response regulator containing a CheY-like receiver domain and an HD-GYP domain n=1 Tax=Marinitoga piezophila (strain DSM 14283 / JCM 11233 / KA3) TaxID=443254 RepID=H2J300_MARPK|nr:HD-GYP domain-containing protein [Marinitoga piezophila]AEX85691.1 response regulator containing a CheY-like receiver domain and an HD-GYP domain [Marinitoga piezophila KA3]